MKRLLVLILVGLTQVVATVNADEQKVDLVCGRYQTESTASLSIQRHLILADYVNGRSFRQPVIYVLLTEPNKVLSTEQKIQILQSMKDGSYYCAEGYMLTDSTYFDFTRTYKSDKKP